MQETSKRKVKARKVKKEKLGQGQLRQISKLGAEKSNEFHDSKGLSKS